jgi:hypothetical protein
MARSADILRKSNAGALSAATRDLNAARASSLLPR